MSLRNDCLTRLAVILASDSINTVVQTEDELDINLYTAAQLPLIAIKSIEEEPDYSVGRHALWTFGIVSKLYFLDARDTYTQKETLVAEIKNALGADPTLDGNCEVAVLTGIMDGGEFPLYTVEFSINIIYEKHIATA